MKRFLAALAFLVVALGVFALTDTASATNGVLDDFTAAYPGTAGTGLASCSTCHTSVPALNAYGSAVKASGMNFAGIEGLDSDGDGFTNLQEIRNLTNPGNAADRPAATSSTTTTTTTTTNATSTTSTTAASGAAATTPTTSSTVPALGSAITPRPEGSMAYDAGPAGTVWLAIENGRLVLTDVESSWRYSVEDESDDDESEVEVTFRSGDREVEFEAELEDGVIRTKVETETEHGHDDDNDHEDDGDHDGDDDRRLHDDEDDDDGDDHDD